MHAVTADIDADVLRALRTALSDVKCLLRDLTSRVITDVPPAAFAVLAHLGRSGPQRTGRIAEDMSLDPSVVSRHVKTLHQHGYVQRVPESDGRASRLQLTAAGTDVLSGVQARVAEEIQSVLDTWSEDDLSRFTGYLRRLHTGLAPGRT